MNLGLESVQEMYHYFSFGSIYLALSVFLCIFCPVGLHYLVTVIHHQCCQHFYPNFSGKTLQP